MQAPQAPGLSLRALWSRGSTTSCAFFATHTSPRNRSIYGVGSSCSSCYGINSPIRMHTARSRRNATSRCMLRVSWCSSPHCPVDQSFDAHEQDYHKLVRIACTTLSSMLAMRSIPKQLSITHLFLVRPTTPPSGSPSPCLALKLRSVGSLIMGDQSSPPSVCPLFHAISPERQTPRRYQLVPSWQGCASAARMPYPKAHDIVVVDL
ncbi:hypothetical protein C8Q80DRAFT_358214 [Daedaleopsis nitida]|nr:hypothetical protein C8Q80DRAFT_358214 [Daedaleopsis nitida]